MLALTLSSNCSRVSELCGWRLRCPREVSRWLASLGSHLIAVARIVRVYNSNELNVPQPAISAAPPASMSPARPWGPGWQETYPRPR